MHNNDDRHKLDRKRHRAAKLRWEPRRYDPIAESIALADDEAAAA